MKLICVQIDVDPQNNRDQDYPLLDEEFGAELIPVGDQAVDEEDPDTFMYTKELEGGIVSTRVVYSVPDDFDIASINPWQEALIQDPINEGFVKLIKISPFP